MSCLNNANRSAIASTRCGLSKIAAASAYAGASVRAGVLRAAGAVDTAAYAVATRTAPAATGILNAFSRAERLGAGKWVVFGAGMAFPQAAKAMVILGKAEKVIGKPLTMAGNAVGDLSRRELVSSTVQNSRFLGVFTKKTGVQAWSSRLTPALNLNDLLTPGDRKNVTASDGVVLKINGKTWHSGTSTVKTPAGERTITHVQSLAMPPRHHYFNRPLQDRELVAVVSGQTNPAAMPGYAGGIGQAEMLCGALVTTAKAAMIKARVFGGTPGAGDVPPGPVGGVLNRFPSPDEAKQTWKQGQAWGQKVKREADDVMSGKV